MLLGMVSIEPGGSKVVKADFSALADRLSPSVQRARRESASTAFCRVIGTIGAAKSGCVVIGPAPLHNPRSILSMTRKLRAGFICCGRARGGWTIGGDQAENGSKVNSLQGCISSSTGFWRKIPWVLKKGRSDAGVGGM